MWGEIKNFIGKDFDVEVIHKNKCITTKIKSMLKLKLISIIKNYH